MTRNSATVRTAIGIDVDTVNPTRSPRYAFAAPKRMPKTRPARTARVVNSTTDSSRVSTTLIRGAVYSLLCSVLPSESKSCAELKLAGAERRRGNQKSGGAGNHIAGVDEVGAIRQVEDFADQRHAGVAASDRNRIP